MARQVLEGVKVADFSWVGVGPLSVKYLADHGATVVHIESTTHPETLRLAPPFRDNIPGINRSGFFANYNTSKYGVSLNLAHPKGREIARRLIMWADIVAESYTPGVMARWGLDYESVRRFKPEVIYLSTCQMGQTGPHAGHPGYGTALSALAGFYHITGWPDREPAGPYGAYTDFLNFRLGGIAILAALEYRRRTGRGQYIDLSQLEGALQFIAPLILDYTVNGRVAGRQGNRAPDAAPHGAYPCKGEDRWCVIAVYTDQQWEALREAMGDPPWARDERFQTLLGRKRHEEELDGHIAGWTRGKTPEEVMTLLQGRGVPAGVVERPEDLFNDPQLRHRGHFVVLHHSEIGPHSYDGIPFKLSKTPGRLRMPAPCLGEHNRFVYREFLGLTDAEIDALEAEGVFR